MKLGHANLHVLQCMDSPSQSTFLPPATKASDRGGATTCFNPGHRPPWTLQERQIDRRTSDAIFKRVRSGVPLLPQAKPIGSVPGASVGSYKETI
jgi:hypothetical protein